MIISVTESIELRASPRLVFDMACDYRNDTMWRGTVDEMLVVPPGEPRVGSVTRELMRFLGKPMVTVAQVTRWAPGFESAFKVQSGLMAAEGYRRVESTPAGARFTYHVEARPAGHQKLLAPLMRWSFRRQVLKDLERLKGVMEEAAAR